MTANDRSERNVIILTVDMFPGDVICQLDCWVNEGLNDVRGCDVCRDSKAAKSLVCQLKVEMYLPSGKGLILVN